MAQRDDAIATAQAALAQAQTDALGALYDQGVKDAPPVVSPDDSTPFSQADIDAAVAKVTAADSAAMQDLQSKLDLEDSQMKSLQASVADAVAKVIADLGPLQPAPAPAPEA